MIDVHGIVAVLQDEYHARLSQLGMCYDSLHAVGRMLHIGIVLDIGEQIHAELVEPQIHDVDATVHILDVNDLFL